ncbi:hypothetical protein FIBSPDRAFT_853216 [Athelia psychrophila]|uniref:Glucose receptor Git3 N-terminal domain-containing protein n=1 Tax=Athelia psychrophila TaxID=1759441 RepID=A0A166R7Y1_9AGAM|nr:hypothetical protein FIBSPDRAFT_853216 [Fibularhizoctonia sp. CBS 109695]
MDSYCNFTDHWQPWLDTLALVISQGILVLRANALYDNSRRMLQLLCTLFACSFGAVTGFSIWLTLNTYQSNWYVGASGCWADGPGAYYVIWMPWVAFDGFLLILTLAKYYQQRNELNATIRLLARDSLFYFTIMFACLLFNVLLGSNVISYPDLIQVPVHSVVCIAVSRMSLNIRGLAFKDVDAGGITMSAIEMASMRDGDQRTLEFKNTDKVLQVKSQDEEDWA